VLVRKVGSVPNSPVVNSVILAEQLAVCVCGGVIYRCTPSWYGNFASDGELPVHLSIGEVSL